MALRKIKTPKELSQISGVSWEVIKRLDEERDIEKIRIENILKLCTTLKCRIEDLIKIPYKTTDYAYLNLEKTGFKSNLRILMAVHNIDRQQDVIRRSGVSWSVITKIDSGENVESIELHNLLKICAMVNCRIQDLINFQYDYEIIKVEL